MRKKEGQSFMSIKVFERNPDGTAWEGRLAYDWTEVRKSNLIIDINQSEIPSIEEAYRLYGVCSTLNINQTRFSGLNELENVYRFLYGYTLDQLVETIGEIPYSLPPEFAYAQQEWTSQMVATMDWDLFSLSYYAFLCSSNDFKSKAWVVLDFILNTLKANPDVLVSLLSKNGRSCDAVTCSEFWATISKGLALRIRKYLHEETCYTAFHSMIAVRPFLDDEEYKFFESECFPFLDNIAKARINEIYNKSYTIQELINLNTELLFFYNEYFEYFPEAIETKKYVTRATFTFLHKIGETVAAQEQIIGADAIYDAALKYAQTDDEKDLVLCKKRVISNLVSAIKNEQEILHKKKEQKAKLKDKLEWCVAVIFLISLITTVVSGILVLFKVWKPTTTIVLITSFLILSLSIYCQMLITEKLKW